MSVEMPVKNQLQGMLAVFEPLDRAQSMTAPLLSLVILSSGHN
jgi:hypothetical protein